MLSLEAAASGPTAFRECLIRLSSNPGLMDKSLRNPRNSQTVLHLALASGSDELIAAASGLATEDLVSAEFEFDVGKISGKKTALHQCVDLGRLDLLKELLFKVCVWGEVLVQRVAVQGLCVGRGVGSESCCSRFVCGARRWFRELLFKVCVWGEAIGSESCCSRFVWGEVLVQRVAVQGLCVGRGVC